MKTDIEIKVENERFAQCFKALSVLYTPKGGGQITLHGKRDLLIVIMLMKNDQILMDEDQYWVRDYDFKKQAEKHGMSNDEYKKFCLNVHSIRASKMPCLESEE